MGVLQRVIWKNNSGRCFGKPGFLILVSQGSCGLNLCFFTIRLALSSRFIGVLKFWASWRSFWSWILLELNASPKTTSVNTGGLVWRVFLSVWVYPLRVWLSWLFFTPPRPSFHYPFCIYSVLIQVSTRNCRDSIDQWFSTCGSDPLGAEQPFHRCHRSAVLHIGYLHWEWWQ